MTASVWYPGGGANRDTGFRAYARDQFGVVGPEQLDKSGFPKTSASPNATPPPLTSLLTLVLDPAWYAQNGDRWRSPLRDKLPITYLDLNDGITENAEVSYSDTPVIGRAEVYKAYIGTMNREITLRFQFRAQGMSGEDRDQSIRKEVIDPAKWLDALKYPVVQGELNIAPPPVILVLGQLLAMRAIATAVTVQWGGVFDTETMLPLSADVEATFTAVHESLGPYNFSGASRFESFQPPSNMLTGEATRSSTSAQS